MQYKRLVYSVQCSVFSTKCMGAGAFAFAGKVCSVYCAVCRVQREPVPIEDLEVERGVVK